MKFLGSLGQIGIFRIILISITIGLSFLIARLIQQTILSTLGESVSCLVIAVLIGVILFCGGIFLHKRVASNLKIRGVDYASAVDLLGAVLAGVGTALVVFTVFS